MTAQEELDEFDNANPRLPQRDEALRQAYDALCTHKYYCNIGELPTSEAIDNAARAIKEELVKNQPLLTQRRVLADAAFRERLGLKPREQVL